ncbi:MAG: hypothetical protein II367_01820 [Treponema sp.]|nr:hypothetical protein [Treponema sp.]
MEDSKKENPQENETLNLSGHEKELLLAQYKKMLGYLKKNGIVFSEDQIDEIEKLLEKDYGNNPPINLKEFLAQF